MLPHYGEEGVDATGYQSPKSLSQTLPIRLVDYFVSACLCIAKSGGGDGGWGMQQDYLHNHNGPGPQHKCVNVMKFPSP